MSLFCVWFFVCLFGFFQIPSILYAEVGVIEGFVASNVVYRVIGEIIDVDHLHPPSHSQHRSITQFIGESIMLSCAWLSAYVSVRVFLVSNTKSLIFYWSS